MNPYDVLGVREGCSDADLKRAYRKLAQKFHPDRNKDPGAAARFVLISEAFNFLTTGVSNTGTFKKEAPKRPTPPPPPPRYDPGPGYGPYGGIKYPEYNMGIAFTEIWGGSRVRIPGTEFFVDVPPFTQNGDKFRTMAKTWNYSNQMIVEVEVSLHDKTGFHQIRRDGSREVLYSQVKVSAADLLSGLQLYLKNINPNVPDVRVKFEAGQKIVKIDHCGLPNSSGRRGQWHIEPIVEFKPLEEERFDTLISLRDAVNAKLQNYYERHPRKADV